MIEVYDTKSGKIVPVRRKLGALDKYVIFSIVMLIVYTVIERVLTCITGVSADTLTTCFYAAFGGEILTCGLIKIFKLKEGESDE